MPVSEQPRPAAACPHPPYRAVLQAREAYASFVDQLRQQYVPDRVKDGVFGAMMNVALENDGPVTFLLDSADPNNQSLGSGGGGSMSSLSSADQA